MDNLSLNGQDQKFQSRRNRQLTDGKFNTEFFRGDIRDQSTTIMQSKRYAYFKEKRLKLNDFNNRLLGAPKSIRSFGFCRSPASVGLPK